MAAGMVDIQHKLVMVDPVSVETEVMIPGAAELLALSILVAAAAAAAAAGMAETEMVMAPLEW